MRRLPVRNASCAARRTVLVDPRGGRGLPQVGTAEGGVDSAIEQLRGHGYKVGRVEQLETAKEAKQRRGNQVPAACLPAPS